MQVRELFNELPLAADTVVPLALQQLLRAELDVTQDWSQAEQRLLAARAELPQQLELGVALYKLYAYSNRFEEALRMIDSVLAEAAARLDISADWRALEAPEVVLQLLLKPITGAYRCYLYSLKATGFVQLRCGDVDTAWRVLNLLQQLDPRDEVGSSVVREMAARVRELEADDDRDSAY